MFIRALVLKIYDDVTFGMQHNMDIGSIVDQIENATDNKTN